ncbi:hypothetical protein BH11PLA2_BH11PLA2_08300 [soil metagenome]
MREQSVNQSRRAFLSVSAAGAINLLTRSAATAQSDTPPVTGVMNANLEVFDTLMTKFITENKTPGASLAVSRYGKLVYARGFGSADVDAKKSVEPAALFRIASVSKPITAVAILQLIEKGKLKFEDKVVDRMTLKPFVEKDNEPDPRWRLITVRQCLQHRGGWDRDKSFDPIGRPGIIAKTLGQSLPVTPADVVRYMMAQPLDFDPGERFAYSNLGYLILGRILEAISGRKYEEYVKTEVLAPLGIRNMTLGRARKENAAKREVTYYDPKNRKGAATVPPKLEEQVPVQYGVHNFEGYEAHGGWIASAVDLVKFASAFDTPSKCPILSAKSIGEMWAKPEGVASNKPKPSHYACGWNVLPAGQSGGLNTWHTGFITGSESLLVRRHDGLCWAVLFNTSNNPEGKYLTRLIDAPLHEAADKVITWPENDQFADLLK